MEESGDKDRTSGSLCQSRFKSLMDKWKSDNADSLMASGTAEEYGELQQLLDDCGTLEIILFYFYFCYLFIFSMMNILMGKMI